MRKRDMYMRILWLICDSQYTQQGTVLVLTGKVSYYSHQCVCVEGGDCLRNGFWLRWRLMSPEGQEGKP